MLVLLAAVVHLAATPQDAALSAIYSGPTKPAVVRRTNRAGAYATVLTSGGRMEGYPITDAILVERFSFGWQALDVLNSRCRLDAHRLDSLTESTLMRGMPKPRDDRPCRGPDSLRDAGPRDDVVAVRSMMRGPLTPYVVVSGNWAMGGVVRRWRRRVSLSQTRRPLASRRKRRWCDGRGLRAQIRRSAIGLVQVRHF